jgi:hypothetical protein
VECHGIRNPHKRLADAAAGHRFQDVGGVAEERDSVAAPALDVVRSYVRGHRFSHLKALGG